MMYLTDLPSLSSLNLEMHSGETETLMKAAVLAGRAGLEVELRFFGVLCMIWEVRDLGRRTRIYSVKRSARAFVSLVKNREGKLTMFAQIRERGEEERREDGQAAVYPPWRQRQLESTLKHGAWQKEVQVGGVDEVEGPDSVRIPIDNSLQCCEQCFGS